MDERRYEVRIASRFEAVWAAGSLDGVGVLRNLSGEGAWWSEASLVAFCGHRGQAPSSPRTSFGLRQDEPDCTRTYQSPSVGCEPLHTDVAAPETRKAPSTRRQRGLRLP